MDKNRNRAYPLWVWDVYSLARYRGCSRDEAFRLLWEIQAGERPTAEYIVEATRALLLWRKLTGADALLALLFRAGDLETFLWTALLLAE